MGGVGVGTEDAERWCGLAFSVEQTAGFDTASLIHNPPLTPLQYFREGVARVAFVPGEACS